MSLAEKANSVIETATDHVANLKNRKLIVGMTYLLGSFSMGILTITLLPPSDVAGALAGLAAFVTGLGGGVLGIIWGITKQAKPGDPQAE